MSAAPLLEVSGLSKSFPAKAGSFARSEGLMVRAVHNVSFTVEQGRTLGLVGESGCGKSTTGRLVLRLIDPDSGNIRIVGEDIARLPQKKLAHHRRQMQIIFQDPLGSLNPRQTVQQILEEPLYIHGVKTHERRGRVAELLREVEMPRDAARRYPHEFSGGQRQRVAIARALALKPRLIVADEPVSALDASIQSQILTLLRRLQDEHGVGYLFISHDLSVVRHLSHSVAVMYFGEIVEQGPADRLFDDPRHPYTRALLAAIPLAEAEPAEVQPLEGQLPSATAPPAGCAFASRCPHVMERCRRDAPPGFEVGPDRRAACWLNESNGAPS
jgi:peptide/nickel transport system ATP-binding protein/oligopeptide transport system ATP-binding protein